MLKKQLEEFFRVRKNEPPVRKNEPPFRKNKPPVRKNKPNNYLIRHVHLPEDQLNSRI